MFETVRELTRYHGMIGNFIKKEIRGKYKGSILGFLWNFIVPITQVVVYLMVFSIVFRPEIEAYPIYLITGMVPWIFFAESLGGGTGTIVANSSLVTKIYFPRSVLPLASTVSKFVNFIISMIIVLIVIAVYGHGFDPAAVLFLPLMMLLLFMFAFGLTLLLSALNAYLRDLEYIVGVGLMIFIWLTPIMYQRSMFDDPLLTTILKLNPMTYFVEAFEQILYELTIPAPFTFFMCLGLAIGALVIGWVAFHRLERDFAEVM